MTEIIKVHISNIVLRTWKL